MPQIYAPQFWELRRVADAAFWPLAQPGTSKPILGCPGGGAGIWRCPWCIISLDPGHRGRWTTKTVGTLGHHPALAQEIVRECLLCMKEALGSIPSISMFFCLSRPLPVGCAAGTAPQTPAKRPGAACVTAPGGGVEETAVVHSGCPHARPSLPSCPTHPAQPQTAVTGGEQGETPESFVPPVKNKTDTDLRDDSSGSETHVSSYLKMETNPSRALLGTLAPLA